ncbi:MAG TPA: hypothetical protein VJ854_05830 [Sphaerochaeta sp.]|nr:hypothetical protein [Sphaerochaeta sp.]
MTTLADQKKLRLKQKDLVFNVLRLFSVELEKKQVPSIWDVALSSSQIVDYLKERYSIDYKTDYWLWTQLKRYEEELGMPLFKKHKGTGPAFIISLAAPYTHFHQKKHLYIAEKLKAANAVYDEIENWAHQNKREAPVKVLLGAGGLCNHIASIFAEHLDSLSYALDIYTHNVGIIEQFASLLQAERGLGIYVPSGKLDPTTYTLLERQDTFYEDVPFDFIVQGTSFVYRGDLYIESKDELPRKTSIAKKARGTRILALSMHEFTDDASLVEDLTPYATLFDYDQVVVPRSGTSDTEGGLSNEIFLSYAEHLHPLVLNWNYAIYQIRQPVL